MLLHSGLLRTGDVWLLSCLPYFFDCSFLDTKDDLRCWCGNLEVAPPFTPHPNPRTSGCSIMIRSCAAMFYYYYQWQLEWICERNRNHVARDWKWEGRSYFQVSQGIMLRSNTMLTRSRLDGVDLHSSISCSFTNFFRHWSRTPKVALLLSLPIKHLLKNPFLPYDSLDSSDGGQNNCWGLELQYLRGALCSRSQKASGRTLSEDLSPALTSSNLKRGYHHDDVTLWYETAFRHLLELETALQNGVFGWNHGKQYGGSICNLLRPARDHIGKEDCRLGWSECDGSYHGKCDRQMDYDCFISISKSALPDSILKTGLLGYFKQTYGSRTSDVFHEGSHLHGTVWR